MVNPGKFQAIIIDKKKKCHTNETLKIRDKIITASLCVKLLDVQIDDQLNFNLHSPTFADLQQISSML